MYLQTKGFILKNTNWREYDRIYTIYTEKAGKITAQARGVRKIQSKLAGHLQPFQLIAFQLVRGKYRFQLTGAQVIQNFQFPIFNFQKKLGYSYYFLELIDKVTKEEQRNEEVFNLLEQAFRLLPAADDEDSLKRLRVSFLLKLLKIKGYNPEQRIKRDTAIQTVLEDYLHMSLNDVIKSDSNGQLKTLFNISQYTLNEIIEEPLKTVKFLQSL